MTKHDGTLLTKIGGLAVAAAVRGVANTLDYKLAYYDLSVDPARPEFQGPCMYLFWHETILFPIALWNNYNVTMLISQHRDAQWINDAASYLGFQSVRGSTRRGGAQAIRRLQRICRRTNLGFTPDGPLGPRRTLSLGPIYLSSRLGLPLIPIGFAFDRPRRLPTWDRFALPRPYSRARSVWGPRVNIPKKIGRDELERYRLSVERMMNRFTMLAEQWAESGGRMAGQLPFYHKRTAHVRAGTPYSNLEPPLIVSATSQIKAA